MGFASFVIVLFHAATATSAHVQYQLLGLLAVLQSQIAQLCGGQLRLKNLQQICEMLLLA